MSYARIADGAVHTYPVDPRREHPYVSFPRGWLGGLVGTDEYAFVHPVDVPQAAHTQDAVKGLPALVDGRWVETWSLVDADPESVVNRRTERWTEVRTERTALLSACDWTQLADAPLTTEQRAAWQAYRQSLRDITRQRDPFSIAWPDTPKG